jgi:class 3 adenylate cyclase/tetratricopeptide (TPR) repeat protein
VDTVDKWLVALGLGQYSEAFESNDISLSELPELTEDDFARLGVSIGHKRRMLREINNIQPPHIPAERRQVTVLFADIVGFTNLSSGLDPEDLLDVINEFQAKSIKLIEAYQGMVIKFVGDGFLAFFGWPTASERDQLNAVRAAKKLTDELGPKIIVDGHPLELRVGIDTGLAVVGDLASNMPDVFGDVPNLAARLQGLAQPSSVLVSEATYNLVSRFYDCRQTEPLFVKGIGDIVAWSIVDERIDKNQSRFSDVGRVPMQGRAGELVKLLSTWENASRGIFQVVCIEGEAGLGKSRLTTEFIQEVGADADIYKLLGSPDAGQSPMRPLIELVEQLAGFTNKDNDTARARKLDELVSDAGLNEGIYFNVLAELFALPQKELEASLTPESRRASLLGGVQRLVEYKASLRPVLLLIEDLHWLDPTTFEFVTLLGGLRNDLSAMILATTRPEQPAPWLGQENCFLQKLAPLSREDAAYIVHDVFSGGNEVLSNVINQIIDRADGIPLYLEELSRSVHITLDNLAIPASLQDSLMARLDRLGAAREVALGAAILGRDIRVGLLSELLNRDVKSIRNSLDQLVVEQVLVVIDNDNSEGFQYRFRHALLLEAAYDNQLLRHRREMHSKAADILADWSEAGQPVNAETMAHHQSKAHRHSEATASLRQGGLVALGAARYEDAERLFKSALSEFSKAVDGAIPTDETKTLELSIKAELGRVLIAREGFAADAVGEAFSDAERIGRELGPGPAMVGALWGMWLFQLVSGGLSRAMDLSKELTMFGEAGADLDDSGLYLEASWASGNTEFWCAELDASEKSLARSISLYDAEKHADHAMLFGQDPFVAAQCYTAYTQSIRGEHSAASAAQKAAIAHAKTLNHPFSTAWALCFPAVVSAFRGEAWGAKRLSSAALEHTRNQVMPFWQIAMTIVNGWATARCGEVEAGLEQCKAGLDIYAESGSKTVQPFFRGLLADCYALAGQEKEAIETLQSGLDLAEETGELVSAVLLHKMTAELGDGNLYDAKTRDQHLMTAIELARKTGARSVELDAAYLLAKSTGEKHFDILKKAISNAPEPTKTRNGRRALKLVEGSQS